MKVNLGRVWSTGFCDQKREVGVKCTRFGWEAPQHVVLIQGCGRLSGLKTLLHGYYYSLLQKNVWIMGGGCLVRRLQLVHSLQMICFFSASHTSLLNTVPCKKVVCGMELLGLLGI